ncbi:hypothetical protein L3X38_020103 [Prunus dulcis]|uniref:Uncharacterized protein n=1 Tax=Prunus dulcis TaxID=3755 RepID=A0AAD4WCE6_PRUDU|nr:hypothetical protein L3X38_020103 [Prunus dulcis]
MLEKLTNLFIHSIKLLKVLYEPPPSLIVFITIFLISNALALKLLFPSSCSTLFCDFSVGNDPTPIPIKDQTNLPNITNVALIEKLISKEFKPQGQFFELFWIKNRETTKSNMYEGLWWLPVQTRVFWPQVSKNGPGRISGAMVDAAGPRSAYFIDWVLTISSNTFFCKALLPRHAHTKFAVFMPGISGDNNLITCFFMEVPIIIEVCHGKERPANYYSFQCPSNMFQFCHSL